jgi:hypothetical protein
MDGVFRIIHRAPRLRPTWRVELIGRDGKVLMRTRRLRSNVEAMLVIEAVKELAMRAEVARV